MCTAISMTEGEHYFGRNLDLDRSYGEEIVVMPRRFLLDFREKGEMSRHYALLGMATVVDNVPLFYDAVNECGLAMAGLNFPENAFYAPPDSGKDNISPFEFIPWILARCKNIAEAKIMLDRIKLVDLPFSVRLPLSPLHWIIADSDGALTVEQTKNGLSVYDNPIGVLTNNPPFPYQMENLAEYEHLRADNKEANLRKNTDYSAYSQGLGAVGLPGDVSSQSRFVRAAFNLKNSISDKNESSAVGQFFHLLSSVEMIRGACITDEGGEDITVYSSCINTKHGIYYYTTYTNRQICAVNMYNTDLDSNKISRFPLQNKQNIFFQK